MRRFAYITLVLLTLICVLGASFIVSSASSTPAQNENPLQINMPDFEDSDFVKYFLFAHWDDTTNKFTNVQLVVLTSDLYPFTADLDLQTVSSGSDTYKNVQARIMPSVTMWDDNTTNYDSFNITRYTYNVDDGHLQTSTHYVRVFDGTYRIYLNEGYKNGVANRIYFRTFGSPYTFTDINYPMHLLPVLFNHNLDWFKTLHDDLSVKLLTALTQIKNTLHTDIVNTNNTLSRIENALSTEITLTRNIYNFLSGTLIAYIVSIDDHLSDIEDVVRELESKLFEEDVTVSNGVNTDAATDASGIQSSVTLPDSETLDSYFDKGMNFSDPSDSSKGINYKAFGFVRQALSEIAFDDNGSMSKVSIFVMFSLTLAVALTFWRRAID